MKDNYILSKETKIIMPIPIPNIRYIQLNQPEEKDYTCAKVQALDNYGLRNVGFMKLEVEGWEINVLNGAKRTLKASGYSPFIFEAWPDAWFSEKKAQLIAYVQDTLKYVVEPIEGTGNMFLALKK